jgi:ribonuclease P protein component
VKRIYSLKGRDLIREVYQKGRKFQEAGIRVFIFKCGSGIYVKPDIRKYISPGVKNIKIAVTLTKSFGKAHIRNRAKRRIQAICSELFNDLRDGFCIIIKIENDFKNKQFEEEKSIIRSLFVKAGLLKSDADSNVQ